MELEARFLDKVAFEPNSGCWLWTGTTQKGYGAYRPAASVHQFMVRAHRYSYERLRWPIPVHQELDHLCRQKRCVNPDHLEPVVHLINVRRGDRPGQRETHCAAGHRIEGPKSHCHICRATTYMAMRYYKLGFAV
jgi:hypothetical protein